MKRTSSCPVNSCSQVDVWTWGITGSPRNTQKDAARRQEFLEQELRRSQVVLGYARQKNRRCAKCHERAIPSLGQRQISELIRATQDFDFVAPHVEIGNYVRSVTRSKLKDVSAAIAGQDIVSKTAFQRILSAMLCALCINGKSII